MGTEQAIVGGLASRVDCKCKGVNVGKSITMSVGLQFNSTRKKDSERKKKKGKGEGEVGRLIFLVRNVRFG